MNVYKRPLFMQQGGMARVPVPTPPAAMRPAAAPQGAMPPMRPAAAPPARPTGNAAGIASMISDKSKMDIDKAQGPEQIINAFRGNQKPIEARYQELAQYVGPQDATSTPVSVLTMVQPALMMTSKGAAESGIGELMANVAGKVNMESAPGQPNRMGQGLGNVMMSRQAPQPAGMAQGGVVGKFEKGGNPLVEMYKEDLPAFQEILAPTQEDRDAAKRQLFFDIAQRGLAMAGGAGGTGNVASQLANVFQTLPQTYAAQQESLRAGEKEAKRVALQSASGRLQAQREQQAKAAENAAEASRRQGEAYQKFIYDMTLENNKAMLKARDKGVGFKGLIAVDTTTNLPISDGGIFNAEDPQDRERMNTFQAGRQNITFVEVPKLSDLSRTSAAPNIKRIRTPNGEVQTFNIANPTEATRYASAMQSGAVEMKVEAPDSTQMTPSDVRGVFADNSLLQSLKDGTVSDANLTRLNLAITEMTTPKKVGTGTFQGGVEVIRDVPGQPLPDQWVEAIQQAREKGVQVQMPSGMGAPVPPPGAQPTPLASQTPEGDNAFAVTYEQQFESAQPLSLSEIQNADLPDLGDKPSGIESAVMEYPIEKVFGTWAAFDRTWNTYGPAVLGLLGPEAAAAAGPEQSEANAEQGLNAFHTLVVESMLAARPGRASNESRQILRELLPNINEARTNKADALGKYQSLQGEMTTDLRRVEGFLSQPLSQSDYQKYDFIRRELTDRLQELSTIVTQLKGSTPGGTRTSAGTFDDIFKATTRVPYAPQ